MKNKIQTIHPFSDDVNIRLELKFDFLLVKGDKGEPGFNGIEVQKVKKCSNKTIYQNMMVLNE